MLRGREGHGGSVMGARVICDAPRIMKLITRVVIIGGGFGGLSAAKVLRNRAGIEVTLLDRRNHHVFQPLLYQVATATLSAGDVAAPIRWILRRARNVRVLLGEADRVDVVGRRVVLA